MREPGGWSLRLRWLTFMLVAAVVAVNAAGVWGIAVARRDALEQAVRLTWLEVAQRARTIESVLSSARADLAFLTGSPAFFRLESALASTEPREVRWGRLSAEGALLLFLRGHSEVMHLTARSSLGEPLVQAGRRGGVPVLWRSIGQDRAAPPAARISAVFSFEAAGNARGKGVALEAILDDGALLSRVRAGMDDLSVCELRAAEGSLLGRDPGGALHAGDPVPEGWISAAASIQADGWNAASPWSLTCARPSAAALAPLDPVTRRYRMTLGLNVAVMALALLLGSFAIQQARRRERLEASAREETRVREVERQLFHTERLGTVGRLAAGMAHEINNPLEGMSNYLSLAVDALSRDDNAAASRHLERVGEGLTRAAGVVRQVLAHADPAVSPMAPLDLNAVITLSVDFVKSQREFRAIEFHTALASPSPGVKGSQVTLGQVFLNLLLNACEAQPGGGEVTISTRRLDETAVTEIADRGPGVPQADMARIFEPFYSTKESTGLGLSVCHSIVRQHGGSMTVERRAGGGALFKIELPSSLLGFS